MTHLEVENLASDYLEGLLDASQQRMVDEHLVQCASCRELVADVRHAIEVCRAAERVEPSPWLVAKILQATAGERKITWRERISAYFRPIIQTRVAYSIAMTVFTFSVIVNAAGLNLRNLRFEDLNPRTWFDRADRQSHLLAARAEKFYYDLRVVVELESRFRELSSQPQTPEAEPSKPAAPEGGSSEETPQDLTVASNRGIWIPRVLRTGQALPTVLRQVSLPHRTRSVNP